MASTYHLLLILQSWPNYIFGRFMENIHKIYSILYPSLMLLSWGYNYGSFGMWFSQRTLQYVVWVIVLFDGKSLGIVDKASGFRHVVNA